MTRTVIVDVLIPSAITEAGDAVSAMDAAGISYSMAGVGVARAACTDHATSGEWAAAPRHLSLSAPSQRTKPRQDSRSHGAREGALSMQTRYALLPPPKLNRQAQSPLALSNCLYEFQISAVQLDPQPVNRSPVSQDTRTES